MKFVAGALLNVTYTVRDIPQCPSAFEVRSVQYSNDITTTYQCVKDCEIDMAEFYGHHFDSALDSYVDDLGKFEDYRRKLETNDHED